MTLTLAAYLHTFSPFVWRFDGDFGIRWYGLSYVAGFVIGGLVLAWLSRRRLVLIPSERVWDAMIIIVLGTIVGGRLGYALVYDPHLFTSFMSSPPWWGLFAINQGGMASHGGLVGLVIAAWIVSRGWKDPQNPGGPRIGVCPSLHVMDCLAVMAPFGMFLGRLANFINGELLGRIVTPPGEPGPWWTVQFPQELLGWRGPGMREPQSHTPDLTLEQQQKLFDLLETIKKPGETWNVAIKRLVEHASDHADALRMLVSSRHPSQFYQAIAEGLVVGVVCWSVWAKPRKPGVVAAWFFITYGVFRVITEIWRLPDAQFSEGRPLGLSRGQWLSVGMVAAGVGILVYAVRRSGEKLGGWMAARNG